MDIFVGPKATGTGDGRSIANARSFTDMRSAVALAAGLTQNADGTWPRDGLESGRVMFLPGTYRFSAAFSSIQTRMPEGTTVEVCPCDATGEPLPQGQRLTLTGSRTWRGTNDPAPNPSGSKGSTAFALAGGCAGIKMHGFHLRDVGIAVGTTSIGSVTDCHFYDMEGTNFQSFYCARDAGSFTGCEFDGYGPGGELTELFHGFSKEILRFGTDSAATPRGSTGNVVVGLVGRGGQQGDGYLGVCVLLGNVRSTANTDNAFLDCWGTDLVSPTSGVYGTQGDAFPNEEHDARNRYVRCGQRQRRDADGRRIPGTGVGDAAFDIKGADCVIIDGFAEEAKRSVRLHQNDSGKLVTLTVDGFHSLNPTKHADAIGGRDSSGGSNHLWSGGALIVADRITAVDEDGSASADFVTENEAGLTGRIEVSGQVRNPAGLNRPRTAGNVTYAVGPGSSGSVVPGPITTLPVPPPKPEPSTPPAVDPQAALEALRAQLEDMTRQRDEQAGRATVAAGQAAQLAERERQLIAEVEALSARDARHQDVRRQIVAAAGVRADGTVGGSSAVRAERLVRVDALAKTPLD